MTTSALTFSAPDWCFFKGNVPAPEYYARLKKMGIDGVEMVDPSRWPIAKKAGLKVLNLCAPGMTAGLNRTEKHAEILAGIRTSIEEARANGVPNVIVFSGNREGQDDKVGIANCVTGLKALVGGAEKAGVTLVFEMLNSMDHKDYQADHSAYGFGVVRGVGSKALKAVYDIYHMHRMGENTIDDIAQNLGLIQHIHVAESPRRTVPVEPGEIDYRKIVQAVQKAGYKGFWGLEFVPTGDPLQELERAVTLFRSFA